MQQRFLLQILLLAQHVSGTTMSIIRSSSRVLYSGCCLWYFVLWFSSCWSGVELRVMCPVCRMLQHPAIKTSVASSWHFISTSYYYSPVPVEQQSSSELGFLIFEASRPHTIRQTYPMGLLCNRRSCLL